MKRNLFAEIAEGFEALSGMRTPEAAAMSTFASAYRIDAQWSEEDAGYIAIVPDLPGCSAWGETEADAILEAYEAIAAWLEAAQAAGRAIPEATTPRTAT